MRLFTKAPGPLVICSNRAVSPPGETDKDIGEEEGERRRVMCQACINNFLTNCWLSYKKSKVGESEE